MPVSTYHVVWEFKEAIHKEQMEEHKTCVDIEQALKDYFKCLADSD